MSICTRCVQLEAELQQLRAALAEPRSMPLDPMFARARAGDTLPSPSVEEGTRRSCDCGHVCDYWDRGPVTPKDPPAPPSEAPARCGICDHTKGAHLDGKGECMENWGAPGECQCPVFAPGTKGTP